MSDLELKRRFVRELGFFLGGKMQAAMSIGIGLGREEAKRWAELRNATPLRGYVSGEDAERQLAEWLGIPLEG